MAQPSYDLVVSEDSNVSGLSTCMVVSGDGTEDLDERELVEHAKTHGIPVANLLGTLEAMANLLSAADWNSDTLNDVADSLRGLGYEIKDLHED